MPKATTHDPEIEAVLAAHAEFADGFRRSRRGNLWRNFQGQTVTIFKRTGDDFYGWCIAGGDERRFSSGAYETEADAMDALASELGVGEF